MSKIAILSFYSGIAERGAETFVYEIAKRLRPKHKVTIFQAGSVIKDQQIRTYQIKAFAKPYFETKSLFSKFYLDTQSLKVLLFGIKASTKILSSKFDVIILMNGGWQTVFYRFLSKIARSKIIITGQAGIGRDDAFNIFFRPDIFVALTEAQLKWAKRISPETKIVKIPNGVDLALFNPNIRATKINLKRPIVVCAAALTPYKRVDLTIKAVAKTKNLSLLVLGDGQLSGSLDSMGKRLLGPRYLRLSVPYKEIPRYYRTGNVFTQVSKTEAFGNVYVEAMACNLPAVATNDPSRAEIIDDAGILTNPEDIQKYAKDLEIAAFTNYKNRPYNQALKFSWNKIAKEYSHLIKELLKNE